MNKDMLLFGQRICFIGAHPDDIELGCGALIASISAQTDIMTVTLSDNQKNPELKNLIDEHYQSMEILGVARENVIIQPFETRNFLQNRQDILEYLFQLNRSFKPEIVFTHTRSDIHQDHGVVTEELLRAFRGTTVLGFDVVRSSYGFFPTFLVEVSQQDVDRKLAALAAYKTYASKYYFDPELTRANLIRNGALAERPYAKDRILRVIGRFGRP